LGGPERNNNGKIKMKVKGCVVFAWIILGIFNQRAVACVTADTDLSGGAWETSAATDPCSGVNHGLLDQSARFPIDPPLSTQNAGATLVAQEFVWSRPTSLPASLLLLVMASCFEFTLYNRDPRPVSTNSGSTVLLNEVGL
jgi:hypothetical protein